VRVLVVGAGAREHALCSSLARNPVVDRIYAAPGNAGMREYATLEHLSVGDIPGIAEFCERESIDLTVVGPEMPLVAGLADELLDRGLPVFGPTRDAAMIEGSKTWARELCQRHGIPGPLFGAFTEPSEALAFLDRLQAPYVVKADGLAAGKGVTIAESRAEAEKAMSTDQQPVHPLRLCKEVRDFLDRDAILVVDGQEILNYGRQSIPTFVPRHRLNSGVFGTMGIGLPFGVGAKVAKPDNQVLVLHGDGSFGLNAMELDTCVRFNIPVVTVVSLNGGWTADPNREKTGRELGYTKFHKMAEALGCHGEYVEDPAQIRPALERAFKADAPALVNVLTDWRARATTAAFSVYST